ncbi:MAG TPA: ketoacyl-ACP synthase III [Planctomycetaceae bacterium]|nr:ketoacyl-ACP synthase III [Planctomycetaceae bacterium]
MSAYLHSIATELAERVQTNDEIVVGVEGWTADKIRAKTGIAERRIAAPDETASDLCLRAAEKLFAQSGIDRNSIDAMILCTQSPDYRLPTTACVLQDRLQLPQTIAAFDLTLGCSGYTYGLWLARSLVLSDSAKNVLLLAGDTYSRYCHPQDLAVASLFGDGATASLITSASAGALAEIGPSALGTDGRGVKHLIVKAGGSRLPTSETVSDNYLYMNGPEIASFAVSTVKMVVNQLLEKVHLQWGDVDGFVFHQANPAFVQKLMQAYRLPPEKVPVGLQCVGNTCSATIPMVIDQCVQEGRFHAGQKIVLVGFGVGYSWAATLLEWKR